MTLSQKNHAAARVGKNKLLIQPLALFTAKKGRIYLKGFPYHLSLPLFPPHITAHITWSA